MIRIAHAADLPTLDEALKSLENGGPTAGAAPRPPAGQPSPGPVGRGNGGPASAISNTTFATGPGGAQTMRLVETTPAPEAFVAARPVAEPSQPAVSVKSLADILALAETHRDMTFKVLLKRCVRPVRLDADRLDVNLTPDAPKTLLNDLTVKLRKWTGRNWLVSLSKEEGGQTLAEMESAKRENAFLDARSDPAVAAILERFPGAKIIDVRIPDTSEADDTGEDLTAEPIVEDDD
jgi:DNA polymerase-3 subunit gamma/tau